MTPSKYQLAIYDAFNNTKDNINISAVAGSGKTTVLLKLLEFVPNDKTALFVAFNNSIVNELKQRISPRPNVEISTIHSFGWRSLLMRYGKAVVAPNKVFEKIGMALKEYPEIPKKKHGYYFYCISKVLDLMRCNLIPERKEDIVEMSLYYDVDLNETEAEMAVKVLRLMNNDKSKFDFMDMVYCPVTDPFVRIRRYDYVFCDESQDFSKAQQEVIKRALARGGRLITVGDENQGIYGFCGADANSYEKLASLNGKSVSLPLSVCYRCSRAVVAEAQVIVPEITAAPDAELGMVREGSMREDLRRGDWILCRNLRPLIQTYLWLLKNKVKSKIKGKDIGEGIIAMINKTGARTLSRMWDLLELGREKLFETLKNRGVRTPSLHPKMELYNQRLDVIECLTEEVSTVDGLKELIAGIFSDDIEGIMLSTIHKAKGLENDRVFFICPELIPSRFATTEWMFNQERNLYYVALTRAKTELIYVMNKEFNLDVKSKTVNIDGRN